MLKLNRHTVGRFVKRIRDSVITMEGYNLTTRKIGGDSKTVEIDETYYGNDYKVFWRFLC